MSQNPPNPPGDRETGQFPGGWGVLEVLVKNRRAVIWYPLIIAVVVAVFSYVIPSSYKAEVTILPPDRDFQSFSRVGLAFNEFGMGGGMSLPFMATPSDIMAHVIRSRRVLDAAVDSLRLDTLWQVPSTGAAVTILSNALDVQVGLTGMLRVRVIDHDPERAADIANALVACADRINRSMANTKARHAREFIEARLADTRRALKEATDELEAFQREHRTISLDDELAALIRNIATLKARLTADEIELSVLKKDMSSQNPRVAGLENRITETRRRLLAMESGSDTNKTFLSTGLEQAPRLLVALAERTRRVKIEETLLELLTTQYESAKIQEVRDTPTISVLDYAEPNYGRFRPQRVRLVAMSYAASLALIVALCFAGEYFAVMRWRQPEKYRRLNDVLAVLRRDMLGLRRQVDK